MIGIQQLGTEFQINLPREVEGDKVVKYLEGAVEDLSEKLTEEDDGLLGLGILNKGFYHRKHSKAVDAVYKPGGEAEIERESYIELKPKGMGSRNAIPPYRWDLQSETIYTDETYDGVTVTYMPNYISPDDLEYLADEMYSMLESESEEAF